MLADDMLSGPLPSKVSRPPIDRSRRFDIGGEIADFRQRFGSRTATPTEKTRHLRATMRRLFRGVSR